MENPTNSFVVPGLDPNQDPMRPYDTSSYDEAPQAPDQYHPEVQMDYSGGVEQQVTDLLQSPKSFADFMYEAGGPEGYYDWVLGQAKKDGQNKEETSAFMKSLLDGSALEGVSKGLADITRQMGETVAQLGSFHMPEKGPVDGLEVAGTLLSQLLDPSNADKYAHVPEQLRDERYAEEVRKAQIEYKTKQDSLHETLGALNDQAGVLRSEMSTIAQMEARLEKQKQDAIDKGNVKEAKATTAVIAAMRSAGNPNTDDATAQVLYGIARDKAVDAGIDPHIMEADIRNSMSEKDKVWAGREVQGALNRADSAWKAGGNLTSTQRTAIIKRSLHEIDAAAKKYHLPDDVKQSYYDAALANGDIYDQPTFAALNAKKNRELAYAQFKERKREFGLTYGQHDKAMQQADDHFWANYNRLADDADFKVLQGESGVPGYKAAKAAAQKELDKAGANKAATQAVLDKETDPDKQTALKQTISANDAQIAFYQDLVNQAQDNIDNAPAVPKPQRTQRKKGGGGKASDPLGIR